VGHFAGCVTRDQVSRYFFGVEAGHFGDAAGAEHDRGLQQLPVGRNHTDELPDSARATHVLKADLARAAPETSQLRSRASGSHEVATAP